MIKNITYNGYTANPSDYDCPDGQLALAYNLINENGALRPILPPSELVTLPDGYTVVHIHQNSNFKHYIVKKGANMLYWFDSSVIDDATQLPISISVNAGNLTPLVSLVNIYMIKSIGNMLIAFTGNGTGEFAKETGFGLFQPCIEDFFFLFLGENAEYSHLVQKYVLSTGSTA